MDVVDQFCSVERTEGSDGAVSSPVTPITITKAEMIDDDEDGNHRVRFDVTFTPKAQTEGEFIITLYADKAPITCENFEKLVKEGFYDGLTFHRVVEDFMAQGGDPNGDGTGGSDETIKGEFSANGVDNDLSHTRGVVSMARSSDMDSASSQFFICYSDDDTFLDGNYAAFGKVTEGMEVVDDFLTISRTTGSDGAESSPVTPITIVKAEMTDDDSDGNHQVKFTVSY
jgi:cyclophilin family peptidyl-prolyl cis-trans isomerase